MSAVAVEQKYLSSLRTIGRGVLNAIYPNDIETYFLALELVDSRNRTVDYFAWPVLPEELRESHNEITNVRKTMTGVNVLKNSTFNPRPILIRGKFGRRFRVLIGGNGIEIAGFGIGISFKGGLSVSATPNFLNQTPAQFSSFVKTGFGCIKVIERIKERSKRLDSDLKPHTLYLYNPILGGNYQVEFAPGESFVHLQDSGQHNMLPSYMLKLIATAPLDGILGRRASIGSALKNLSIDTLQKLGQGVANDLRSRI